MNSLDFLAALQARETDAVFLDLITIDSPQLGSPIRLVNDRQAQVSRSLTFSPWSFRVAAPGQREDRLPTVSLVMDAIYDPDGPMTGGPVGLINTIQEGTVTLEWILASDPDTVEYGPFEFTITGSSFDAQTVTVTLAYEDLLNAEWPGHAFTPITTPAVFEG